MEGLSIASYVFLCYLVHMDKSNDNVEPADRYGQTGYPYVEKLIETEQFDDINRAFENAYADLYEISRRKKGFKTKKDVKKAMRALELTMDILRELLAIKYRLQEEMANSKKNKEK